MDNLSEPEKVLSAMKLLQSVNCPVQLQYTHGNAISSLRELYWCLINHQEILKSLEEVLNG